MWSRKKIEFLIRVIKNVINLHAWFSFMLITKAYLIIQGANVIIGRNKANLPSLVRRGLKWFTTQGNLTPKCNQILFPNTERTDISELLPSKKPRTGKLELWTTHGDEEYYISEFAARLGSAWSFCKSVL